MDCINYVSVCFIKFILLWYGFSKSVLSMTFIVKWRWILSESFCAFVKISIWFLFLSSLILFITLICLPISEIKPEWSFCFCSLSSSDIHSYYYFSQIQEVHLRIINQWYIEGHTDQLAIGVVEIPSWNFLRSWHCSVNVRIVKLSLVQSLSFTGREWDLRRVRNCLKIQR